MTTAKARTYKASESAREVRTIISKIFVCYFLSGAAGLTYQILWLRKLLLVFGSTVHAVSTVLTVFFGGLALGSWVFGRLIDRRESDGLRWYAYLEAGIGVFAFCTLPLFDAIQQIYIPIYRASGFSQVVLIGASFLCSTAILIIPTMLMGGTFPILSRFLIRSSEERGAKIASLYGINTLGAMAGTLVVYYIGLPLLGLQRTLLCTGVLNLGVGALCLLFDRQLAECGAQPKPTVRATVTPAAYREAPGDLRWLLAAFGLSGFSAMVYEVSWTRALSLVLGSSIYAFCLMLATFLGGMALGSFWAQHFLHREPARLSWIIQLELALGVYGLCSIMLFPQLPQGFVTLWPLVGHSFAGLAWLHVVLSVVAMAFPTLAMGLLFPIVADVVTGRFATLGERLGGAYAINTLGGIAGSFLSGFVLIPMLGLPSAILVAALVNVAAASVIYIRFGQPNWSLASRTALAGVSLIATVVIGKVIALPAWQREVFTEGVYLAPDVYQSESVAQSLSHAKLLYYRDSLNTTVSVHQLGNQIYLKVGGKTDASSGIDMGTQVLSAHIPLLLHRDPHSVLVIGLGSGVTLGAAGRYPVSVLDCAEIDPAVIEGARYFKAYNHDIHHDPRARIVAADGRNFLLASPRSYDVIISEPSNPWMAGVGYLFTQEFYHLAKRHLAAGGAMCQWLQIYRMFPGDVKLLLKTFHEEFPYVSVWSSIPGDLLLVGSMEPQRFDEHRVRQRMATPSIRENLAMIHIDRPDVLLQNFWFSERALEQLTADVSWVHQDDQPWIEFDAPKALYAGGAFSANFLGLESFKESPATIVSGYSEKTRDRAFYVALASMRDARHEDDQAQRALEQAIELDPQASDLWVRLAELSLKRQEPLKAKEALMKAIAASATNATAYRWLGWLHWQQHQLKEAARWYRKSSSLKAPDDQLAEEMGTCFREAQQLAWAAEFYRSAISQGGGDRSALLIQYAQTLMVLKASKTAKQVMSVGMAKFPTEAAFPLMLGEMLVEQQRWQEAAPLFQLTRALVPRSTTAYYGLGRIALAEGRASEAARYLKVGLRYNPYHRPSLELLHQLQQKPDVTKENT